MCNEKECMFYLLFKQKPLIKKNFVFQSQTTYVEASSLLVEYILMFLWVGLDQSILKYPNLCPSKKDTQIRRRTKDLKTPSFHDRYVRKVKTCIKPHFKDVILAFRKQCILNTVALLIFIWILNPAIPPHANTHKPWRFSLTPLRKHYHLNVFNGPVLSCIQVKKLTACECASVWGSKFSGPPRRDGALDFLANITFYQKLLFKLQFI